MSPGDNGRSLVAVLLSLRLVLARVFFGFGTVSAGFADLLSGACGYRVPWSMILVGLGENLTRVIN